MFQEAPWDIPTNQPPSNWPEKGEVEFKDYQVRYREGLDLVLRGISYTVKGGEKVNFSIDYIWTKAHEQKSICPQL
jgi:ABC-type multidrug transport system fused ATPase/permease subunit